MSLNTEDALTLLREAWPYVAAVAGVVLSILASGHAILFKRDHRAAVGWVGLAWLVPVVGPVLYWLLGINRIQRRAKALRMSRGGFASRPSVEPCRPDDVREACAAAIHLESMHRLSDGVTSRPLLSGNRIDVLDGGAEAYAAMLEAIAEAERSVVLCTYIFDNDRVGRQFVEALAEATKRGVEVRVLIDAVGSRYSTPPVSWKLRRAGVPYALFMRTRQPGRWHFMNLRNHRKIMVVDGVIGFTGGMNIRDDFWTDDDSSPAWDLQFRVEGPVVGHLAESFAEDWAFATREVLQGDLWFPPLEPQGELLCRGITDGPDEDFETLRYVLLGALSVARHSVHIVTPYFLPDPALITALRVAAYRGVQVNIVLPERSNIPMVQWATFGQVWQVMEAGCRVFLVPPPFDHSKLMVVDGMWSLIGSANWDPRSLRLNFEFSVETFGSSFGAVLERLVERRLAEARPLAIEDLERRPFLIRLRDGIARLFTPYL